MSDRLQAGLARADITPPVGTRLLGYASRTQPSTGVRDPLTASAVVLSDGAARVAILALDICWLDFPEVAALKDAVGARTGLAPESVLVNFSHTHAGPVVARMADQPLEDAYLEWMIAQAAEVAERALADLAPAALQVGEAPVDVGTNRRQRTAEGQIILGRNPEGTTLGEVTVWRLVRQGADDLVLFSIPVHGTVMGGDNLLISAEWTGAAVRFIEEREPGLRAVFLQGCAADQNPYRGDHTFAQVDHLGDKAASAVAVALRGTRSMQALPLRTLARDMALPLAEGGTAPCPIHGLRLGEAVLVGLGGEAYVEFALHTRAQARARSVMALGYTDGSVGYLPTAISYEEGGYEPNSSHYFALGKPWHPSVEQAVKDEIDALLRDLDVGQIEEHP